LPSVIGGVHSDFIVAMIGARDWYFFVAACASASPSVILLRGEVAPFGIYQPYLMTALGGKRPSKRCEKSRIAQQIPTNSPARDLRLQLAFELV
jgi:hypothetical protein